MAQENTARTSDASSAQGNDRAILRDPQPGDLGWIVSRHGELYAADYGWTMAFEALVAGIMAAFGEHHDPERERLWIAEIDGEKVGSIMLVRDPDTPGTAKLRVLLVEPAARGKGVGTLLVETCVQFAREAGYTRVVLWTEDVLTTARAIYRRAGFTCVASEPNDAFGAQSTSETWELVF